MRITRIPDHVRLVTDEKSMLMEPHGNSFKLDDVTVSFKEYSDSRNIPCLDVTLTAPKTTVQYIYLRWNGETAEELENGCWPQGTTFCGDAIERTYGELSFLGMNQDRMMPWYFIAAEQDMLCAYGVKTCPNCLCYFNTDPAGIALWMDVRSGEMGVELGSKVLEVATIIDDLRPVKSSRSNAKASSELIAAVANNLTNVKKLLPSDMTEAEVYSVETFDFIKGFCAKMCENPLLADRPIYGSNNWYYAYGDSSADQIRIDTDLLVECCDGLDNRPFMVIDDCWQPLARTQKHGAMGRPCSMGNELFPDMKGLADDIRAKGAHPGLWMRPLRTEERFLGEEYRSPRDRGFLDPSVPEAMALVAEDISRMTGEWGYELIKYDFVFRDITGHYGFDRDYFFGPKPAPWHFRDRSVTTAECFKLLFKTIKDNAHGAILIGCNVPGHLATGYIHLHRSGDDTSGRIYDRSIRMGINAMAFRMPQHKTFFDIDADCVCITDMIPWDKNKLFTDFYAKSGTPLFVSVAPAVADEDVKDALKKAYAPASKQADEVIPLDWLDNTSPEKYLMNGVKVRYPWIRDIGRETLFSL